MHRFEIFTFEKCRDLETRLGGSFKVIGNDLLLIYSVI